MRWQNALVYLDYIVIFLADSLEHVGHAREVLTLLCDAGETLKLKKLKLVTKFGDYLSHVIRPWRLEVSFHTTNAIRRLKTPTSLTELQYLLGLCNVLRRFDPNFDRLAVPLKQKLKNGQPASFRLLNEQERNCMNLLEEGLILLPFWRYPTTVDT